MELLEESKFESLRRIKRLRELRCSQCRVNGFGSVSLLPLCFICTFVTKTNIKKTLYVFAAPLSKDD